MVTNATKRLGKEGGFILFLEFILSPLSAYSGFFCHSTHGFGSSLLVSHHFVLGQSTTIVKVSKWY